MWTTVLLSDLPIFASLLLPSNNKKLLKVFEAYLREDNRCFETFSSSKELTEAFPLLVRMLQKIENEEHEIPTDVQKIFQAMIDLKRKYTSLAKERAVPRIKPGPGHKPVESEIYPLYPLHTLDNDYEADMRTEGEIEDSAGCNKYYNDSVTISGGICHVTCQHSICKGFTAMRKGESPLMVVGRFNKTIKDGDAVPRTQRTLKNT